MAGFAAGRLGQFRNKLNLARIFLGCDQLFTVGLKFEFQFLPGSNPRPQDHTGFDDLPPERVWLAYDSRLEHRRVFEEGTFNLKGPDPVA